MFYFERWLGREDFAFGDGVLLELRNERAFGAYEMDEAAEHTLQQIADWLASGQLKCKVSQTFGLAQLLQEHASLETGRVRGKIVITL